MKVLCIVQARMGSERLPGKVIKPILNKPMILYTLDRLSKSKHIDEIVLATSIENGEQPLVDITKNAGYKVFRGDENNVLKRYKDVSEEFLGDIIIRVTGDCPLIDSVIVDNAITYFKMNNFDYARLDVPKSFIRGFDVEVFSKEALNRAYNAYEKCMKNIDSKSNEEKVQIHMYGEHVTYYMYKHPKEFNIGYVQGNKFYNKDYRLCVDTVEDFQLVKHIYEHFNNAFVASKEVVEFLDSNSEIALINSEIEQKSINKRVDSIEGRLHN